LFGNPELGIERDAGNAVNLFQQLAVNNNNVHAHEALGVVYSQGIGGVEQNSTKAIEHLEIAAQAGSPGAWNTLGYMYNNGLGV
jgi:TPR repeat protein